MLQQNKDIDRGARPLRNIRQITLSFQFYLADNDDSFPFKSSWQTALNPYLKSDAYYIPSYQKDPGAFAMNQELSQADLGSLRIPSQTPVVFESKLKGRNRYGSREDLRRIDSKVKVGFADGAAKQIFLSEADELDWLALHRK